MSDELKAAISRLRPWRGLPLNYRGQVVRDMELIVTTYLAEHPEDEDDCVTEPWWLLQGWEPCCDENNPGFYFDLESERRLEVVFPGGPMCLVKRNDFNPGGWEHLCDFAEIKTHGGWYRLCAALGIECRKDNEL